MTGAKKAAKVAARVAPRGVKAAAKMAGGPLLLHYSLIPSPFGNIGVCTDSADTVYWTGFLPATAGATAAPPPAAVTEAVSSWYRGRTVHIAPAPAAPSAAVAALRDYLHAPAGTPPAELERWLQSITVHVPESATPFTAAVWRTLRSRVPAGSVTSYSELGRKVKGGAGATAARAVGRAMQMNPIPIIVPCHRVLTASGALGGFSSGCGMKVKLLRHERAPVRKVELDSAEGSTVVWHQANKKGKN